MANDKGRAKGLDKEITLSRTNAEGVAETMQSTNRAWRDNGAEIRLAGWKRQDEYEQEQDLEAAAAAVGEPVVHMRSFEAGSVPAVPAVPLSEAEMSASEVGAVDEDADAGDEPEFDATPRAIEVAEELGVPLADVEGTGEDGRITVDDVRAAAGEAGAEE